MKMREHSFTHMGIRQAEAEINFQIVDSSY